MTFHPCTVGRTVIDVFFEARVHGDLQDLFRHLLAARAGPGEFGLGKRHLGVDLPELLLLVGHRLSVQGAVAFAAVASDVDESGNLDGVAASYLLVKELVRVGIDGSDAGATAEAEADTDAGVGLAIELQDLHQLAGAKLLRGVTNVIVGGVGAMLKDVVAGERQHAVVKVNRRLGQGDLLRRLDLPHVEEVLADVGQAGFGQRLLETLGKGGCRLEVYAQFPLAKAPAGDALERPFKDFLFLASFPLDLIVFAGVGEIEVPLKVLHPPTCHHVPVEARNEGCRVARGWHKEVVRPFRLCQEDAREIVPVQDVGDDCAVQPFLPEDVLEAADRVLIPANRQPERSG